MKIPRLSPRKLKETALPPGSLVHVGERPAEDARIRLVNYDEGRYDERIVEDPGELAVWREMKGVVWVDVEGVHDTALVERIGDLFGLHRLMLEDVVHPVQRPKQEEYDDSLFMILAHLSLEGERLGSEQVSVVLGETFVISFRERRGDLFDPVLERLRLSRGRARKCGADYLAYVLLDTVVDYYFVLLERMGAEIERLEDDLVADHGPRTLRDIHQLRRALLFFRSSVWPLRQVLGTLQRGDSTLVRPETGVYFRDVYDHSIAIIENIESYREMVAGMLDIYLSSASNRMNEVMKVLTVIATVFIPLTFIAGVYGMNFRHMPELEWRWGYYGVLGIMAAVFLGMVVFFRRKKWF